MSDDDADGPVDPEPMIQLSELRALLSAVRTLGDKLRDMQLSAYAAPDADHSTTVLFGMAPRMYRLLVDFLDRPSSWAPATASFFVRPLVETRIVSAWLCKKSDPNLIEAYREHGLGNLKLLRDHIRADFGEGGDGAVRQTLDGVRLCGRRQRAVLPAEHDDAVRRREEDDRGDRAGARALSDAAAHAGPTMKS